MKYIEQLIERCNMAKQAKPIREFEMQKLSETDGITQAIYIIEQIGGNPENTFEKLFAYKQRKERASPKLNSASHTMYVGSTTTGLKKRISQHIGNGPKDTYALHLSQWFDGEYKITVKEYDIPAEVLHLIEDALSDELKPAFGKLGSNNR